MKIKKMIAMILTCFLLLGIPAGCGQAKIGSEKGVAPESTAQDLYFTRQEERESPAWVTALPAARDARQLIVVAGINKTTAYVTLHEKGADGVWRGGLGIIGFRKQPTREASAFALASLVARFFDFKSEIAQRRKKMDFCSQLGDAPKE